MHRYPFVLSLALTSALAPFCPAQAGSAVASAQSKRPMTFEDMMAMKRLGETAVSPDGKWLAYSVTTVNLAANSKTTELFIQPIAGGDAKPLTAAQPGDSGPQFSADGKRILFQSSREGGALAYLPEGRYARAPGVLWGR